MDRRGTGLRRRLPGGRPTVGAAMAPLLALVLVGCALSAGTTPSPVPTPPEGTPRPTLSPSPTPIEGVRGRRVELPGVAALIVRDAREYPGPEERYAGYRFIAVDIDLSAIATVTLGAESFWLSDRSNATYAALPDGAGPRFDLATALTAGRTRSGVLSFLVPVSGTYRLWFTNAPGSRALAIPLGAVAPLPTPVPTPTPSMSVVPSPSAEPSGSAWTPGDEVTKAAYLDSVDDTYDGDVPLNVAPLYSGGCSAGQTAEECAARTKAAAESRDTAVRSIRVHLTLMADRPAAACFRDAYAADRAVATNWLQVLARDEFGNPATPEGQRRNDLYDAASSVMERFLLNLDAYFADCG